MPAEGSSTRQNEFSPALRQDSRRRNLDDDISAAFRHLSHDREFSFSALLSCYNAAQWSTWTNSSGDTLLNFARRRKCMKCLKVLEEYLEDASPVSGRRSHSPPTSTIVRSSGSMSLPAHTVQHHAEAPRQAQVATPRQVIEKVVEVPCRYDGSGDVEVPQHHHEKVFNYVAKIEEELVEHVVEVPQITTIEKPVLQTHWAKEESVKQIPRTVIRDRLTPRIMEEHEETEEIVHVPVYLPPKEVETRVPKVDIQYTTNYIPGQNIDHPREEETIEIPHVVQVQNVTPVLVNVEREVEVPYIVNNIHRVEKPQEVLVEQVRDKVVEVPQLHKVHNVRYVPVFVDEDVSYRMSEGYRAVPHTSPTLTQDLEELRRKIQQLESQRDSLADALEQQVQQITQVKHEIQQEKLRKTETLSQLEILGRVGLKSRCSPGSLSVGTPTTSASVRTVREPLGSSCTSYFTSPGGLGSAAQSPLSAWGLSSPTMT